MQSENSSNDPARKWPASADSTSPKRTTAVQRIKQARKRVTFADSVLPKWFSLETELLGLKDLVAGVEEGQYGVQAGGNTVALLNELTETAFALVRAASCAIGTERVKQTRRDTMSLTDVQELKFRATLEEKRQCEREISEFKLQRAQQLDIIKSLQEKRDDTTKALEQEKESRLCQICMEKSRDTVILGCMHFLYCYPCLEAHKLNDNRCPVCRQEMNGMCKVRI